MKGSKTEMVWTCNEDVGVHEIIEEAKLRWCGLGMRMETEKMPKKIMEKKYAYSIVLAYWPSLCGWLDGLAILFIFFRRTKKWSKFLVADPKVLVSVSGAFKICKAVGLEQGQTPPREDK
uniref:Uncharacterized protein n=1 Tax=Timema shepardi TaxID=629360 RepID=A0A7R9G278_TIMSH|nr:unnamed protein product [Timema shepardi]